MSDPTGCLTAARPGREMGWKTRALQILLGKRGWHMDDMIAVRETVVALTPFHLAFPVHDLQAARHFYGSVLGCPEGRSADTWIDFNLFGHQIVAHYKPSAADHADGVHSNPVDGHDVPVPHFGVVLTMPQWTALAARLAEEGVDFIIEPHIRFVGQPGEQATMFFLDPSGNALEFKAFADFGQIFAR
jgi:extradiol dioxygenase family protein